MKWISEYQKRVEGYGFVYRPLDQLLRFAIALIAIVAFAYYFEMHISILSFLIVSCGVTLPLCILWQYEYLHDEVFFKEFTMMIQQMAASFKLQPKILTALIEVRSLTSEILLHDLNRCIDAIESGESYQKSLSYLEDKYPFFVLKNLHSILISVELYGAYRYQEGLTLIQDDLEDVVEDMYLLQQEINGNKNKVFILCGLALVVGMLAKQMLGGLFDCEKHMAYQIALLGFVISLMVAVVYAQKSLRHTWYVWEH